jgi:hypothetical protein
MDEIIMIIIDTIAIFNGATNELDFYDTQLNKTVIEKSSIAIFELNFDMKNRKS